MVDAKQTIGDVHDLAVRWEDGAKAVRRIRKEGFVELHGRPHHLKSPGGTVAIVQADGHIALLFKTKRIVSAGKRHRIEAYRSSIRVPAGRDPMRLSIKWYAIGQFRYFTASTNTPLNLSGVWTQPGAEYMEDLVPAVPGPIRIPFEGGIPGREKNDPEAQLVNRYVAWLGSDSRFCHQYMRGHRVYTALLDRRYWRLLEARIDVDREILHHAVGQLLDYRQAFARRPSLGILLSSRPRAGDLAYLDQCGFTAVWETASGRFSDSSETKRWSARS